MSERLIQKASTLRKPKRSSLLPLPEKGDSAHLTRVSVSRLGQRLPRASLLFPGELRFATVAFAPSYLFIYTLPRVASHLRPPQPVIHLSATVLRARYTVASLLLFSPLFVGREEGGRRERKRRGVSRRCPRSFTDAMSRTPLMHARFGVGNDA